MKSPGGRLLTGIALDRAEETPKPPRLSSLSQSMLSLHSDHFSGMSYEAWEPDCPVSFLPSHGAFDAFPLHGCKPVVSRRAQKLRPAA